MKFWELVSVTREEPWLAERLGNRAEWATYLSWFRDIDQLVQQQDRSKLDAELPDEACFHVLSASRRRYYLFGGYLRVRRYGASDVELSVVETFNLFGGRALEDASEYGSVSVPGDDASTGADPRLDS
jgi:hypothetical protein